MQVLGFCLYFPVNFLSSVNTAEDGGASQLVLLRWGEAAHANFLLERLGSRKLSRDTVILKSTETCRGSIKPTVQHTLSVPVIVQSNMTAVFFKFFIFLEDVVPNPFQFGLSLERSSGSDCRWKISSRKCGGPSAKPVPLTHHSRLLYECTSAYGQRPRALLSHPEEFHLTTECAV